MRQEICQRVQNVDARLVGWSELCSLRSCRAYFWQREKPNPWDHQNNGPTYLWREKTKGGFGEVHGIDRPHGQTGLKALHSVKVFADGLMVRFFSCCSLCYGAYPCHLHGKKHSKVFYELEGESFFEHLRRNPGPVADRRLDPNPVFSME